MGITLSRDAMRDAAIGLSLANLLFVRVWADLFIQKEDLFYLAAPPRLLAFWLPVVFVLVVAAFFWIFLRSSRRAGKGELERTGRVFVVTALLLGLNGARSLMPELSLPLQTLFGRSQGLRAALVVLAVIGVGALFTIARMPAIMRLASRLALALAFLVPVTLGRAVWEGLNVHLGEWDAAMRDRAPAPRQPGPPPERRVLVLLFDELDETVAFSDRPKDLVLPELDRLRAQSIACENAYSPSFLTDVCVPAMLTGLDLEGTVRRGPNSLWLQPRKSTTTVRWRNTPDLFSLARAAGYDAAIAGWYLPYCRIIGDRVVHCEWFPGLQPPATTSPIFWGALTRVIEVFPGAVRTGFAGRLGLKPFKSAYGMTPEWHIQQWRAVRDATIRLAVDPTLGLVFAHFPIPHEPFVFDRATLSPTTAGETSYEDNLAFVDLTLGQIRARMEAAGQWDRTAVIVLGDHWWRRLAGRPAMSVIKSGPEVGNRAQRVPLMIKPAGSHAAISFSPTVQTTVLKDLALELLRPGARDAADLVSWLQSRIDSDPAGRIP